MEYRKTLMLTTADCLAITFLAFRSKFSFHDKGKLDFFFTSEERAHCYQLNIVSHNWRVLKRTYLGKVLFKR